MPRAVATAVAIVSLAASPALAQSWLYQSGPGGTPPQAYYLPHRQYQAPMPQAYHLEPPDGIAPSYRPPVDYFHRGLPTANPHDSRGLYCCGD